MIIHNVEQGTDEWHALRAGIPTASEGSKLVTSKGEPSKQMGDYAIQLAADLYAGEPLDRWQGNEWTERGHEMEDRARAYYENSFPDRVVTRVGFVTDDDQRAGASPDSMVQLYTDDEKTTPHPNGNGMLEIKCTKASTHVKLLVFYERNGRMPSDYIVQPQFQMLIAERDWCDSLFWHPELPALIVRNTPDEKIVANLRLQIASCIDERDKIIGILNQY